MMIQKLLGKISQNWDISQKHGRLLVLPEFNIFLI